MNAMQAESPTMSVTASPAGASRQAIELPLDAVSLPAELVMPAGARGLVLCLIAKGCTRELARVDLIARAIEARGMATLSFPLLTETEARQDGYRDDWSFDLELLTGRLLQATHWALQEPRTRGLAIGYVGTSTCASAALVTAARLGNGVRAIVCRAGRPDFAGDALSRVTAPTMLIVGERDEALLAINRRAWERLTTDKRLCVVTGAGHLFAESGAVEQVADLAADWFGVHLK